MNQPTVYRCIKDLKRDSRHVFFTAGQEYKGWPHYPPIGATRFRNDQGKRHIIGPTWFDKHFVKVEPVEAQS